MAAEFCNDEAWMPWNGTDYSWVGTSRTSSMSFACTPYEPNEYAPLWYNRLGLAIICVANSLAIIAIVVRTYLRWRKMKSFGKDDWWLMAAGLLITCVYFPALLVSNRMGVGLFVENIPFENRQALWLSMSGWAFYFIIASMIKVATCMYYLRIIPDHRTRFQHIVYVLATTIMILGLVEAGIWVFNCNPVEANFIYNLEYFSCPPVDKARWTNIYGVLTFEGQYYNDEYGRGDDFTHSEAAFILINNAEVLMYVVGACFPVLSPYLVSLARSVAGSRRKSTTLPSWRVFPIDAFEAHQFPRRESHPKKSANEGLNTVLENDEDMIRSPATVDSDRRIGTGTTMVVSLSPDFGETGLGLLKKASDGELSLNIEIPAEAHTRSSSNNNKGPATEIDLERGDK
ncbi:hypothetical protein ABW19_dt0209350 [Dactylella cylindrospora]|nr:hypothetical protein ABW19_dt0209350 [Dactylella cylindrospora]